MSGNVVNDRTVGRLTLGTKVLFGSGQGVEVSATFVANTFLLFYLTNIVGMTPAAAGMVIFLSLAFDAVVDPLIGSWSDRSKSRWGRRLPFMVLGLPLVCLASIALFAAPLAGGTAIAFSLALVLNIALRVGTSLYALPYAALTAELTHDYDERSSVTVYRMIFGFIGTVLTIAPAFGYIFVSKEDYASRWSYIALGLLLSAVVSIMGAVCILGVRRAVLASPAEHLPAAVTSKNIVADLWDLVRNRNFVVLFAASLTALITAGSMNSLNLYAYTYFWKLPPALNQVPLLSFQAGLLLGIPITALLLRRFEKREVVMMGVGVISTSQVGAVLLALLFLQPLPNAAGTAILAAGSCVFGACNSLFFISFTSQIADAVDDHELKFGQRCEGLFFSSLVFSAKAATGIGSLIAGLVLTAVGLKAGAGAASVLPEASATWLGVLWGVGHGAAFLLIIPFAMANRLTRRCHRSTLDELALRRSAATAP